MPRTYYGDDRDRIPHPNPCTLVTVDRMLYIIDPIKAKDKWDAPYLSVDLTPLKIAKAVNGIYEIELPIGEYWLCVEDNGKKYCAARFTIEKDDIQEFNIEINHATW